MTSAHWFGTVKTDEYHTAGEPFRIVVSGAPETEGETVLERRSFAKTHLDDLRAFLVNEPRGHADMYGGFVTPPDDDEGDLGVIFFHKDGFSTACGHGTIALATWAVDSGRIEVGDRSEVEMFIDVPSGRLRVVVEVDDSKRATRARFWNVDSFVTAEGIEIKTSYGKFAVDVSFGGAFYGSVPLDDSELEPSKQNLGDLIDIARQIKSRFAEHEAVTHHDDRLSGMYGVIFHRDSAGNDADLHQQNVTVFADGEVDRSPCGSGTSARLAVLEAQGRLSTGQLFHNQGIAGGLFEAKIEGVRSVGDQVMVATSVAGAAYRTGQSTFTLDDRDPIGLGFQLR